MFSPTLVNEARFGYTRTPTFSIPFDQGTNYNALLGTSGGPTDPKLIGFPEITISGYAQLGPAFQQPNSYTSNAFDFSDTLTWVKGPHLIKFGGRYPAHTVQSTGRQQYAWYVQFYERLDRPIVRRLSARVLEFGHHYPGKYTCLPAQHRHRFLFPGRLEDHEPLDAEPRPALRAALALVR
jgi:hypothetical protein